VKFTLGQRRGWRGHVSSPFSTKPRILSPGKQAKQGDIAVEHWDKVPMTSEIFKRQRS